MAQDIRTYPGLIAAAQAWLDSAESSLTDAIPNMIVMAESDFRRQILTPDMEITVSIDPSAPSLPSDVASVRLFALTGIPQGPLEQVEPTFFSTLDDTATGTPQYYTISGYTMAVWPQPDMAYTANMIYRQAIPSLSATNPTNWLLTAHPDAYLFGTLLQAEFFGWNDDRLPIIQSKLASIIDDINTAGNRKRYGGALTMRANVSDAVIGYCV